jgi:hypothetical protein
LFTLIATLGALIIVLLDVAFGPARGRGGAKDIVVLANALERRRRL